MELYSQLWKRLRKFEHVDDIKATKVQIEEDWLAHAHEGHIQGGICGQEISSFPDPNSPTTTEAHILQFMTIPMSDPF